VSKPPPDLMQWPKRELVRELERLRAITREHAERRGDDPRISAGTGAVVGGSPRGEGDALLDARSAVLLDGMEVVLVDTKSSDPVSMLMELRGRVNYSTDHVRNAYLFGPDGAAAIVTQVLALAGRCAGSALPHARRFADEYESEVQRRLSELP
jgi:hypothetical protein